MITQTIRAAALAALIATWPAGASTTATWEMNSFQDFAKGRFSGVSLSRDGRLTLSPKLDPLFSPDQPEVWSVAKAPDGSLYLGTGHRGRLYKVDANGAGSLIWTAEQPEIFAVAVDEKGAAYAATSPDGRVYKIENGKATEFFNPREKYIWAMIVAPDGSLFLGTGDQGKVYHVTPDGKGEVYYESGQMHITSLAIDSRGRLLAGSEPNGILYRLTAPKKAFVLYDANLPEVRSILPTSDGSVYVAALGGSMTQRATTQYSTTTVGGSTVVSAPGTSVTVTDTQAGPDLKNPKADTTKPAASAVQPVSVQPGATVFDVAGVDKSAVYKIRADNTVETLWTSKDENIYDLAASDGQLIFSTDAQGRIYRLGTDRKPTLIAQTGEGETTRLLSTTSGIIATTGQMGRVYRLGQALATEGVYNSPVHDSNTVARWGRLIWRGEFPSGAQLSFRTRTGNSARPDNTWSDWSAPLTDRDNSLIQSPNARYIQWRAEFRSSSGATAALDSVNVAYLPQNTPPVVRSITASMQASAALPKSSAQSSAAASTSSAFSITVTDTGEPAPQTSSGTPTQTLSRGSGQQTQIVWQADDADGDRLVYSLYFRGDGENEWKLLRTNYFENSFALDSDVLADGLYAFRVVASDRPSNPLNLAHEAELVSAPVLIDNTPPVVTAGAPRRNGTTLDIDVEAVDRTSPLRRCEYSIDAGPWLPVEAADGVTDSPEEKYAVHVDNLRPGEHLVVIRAYDSANNAGLTKIVLH